MNLISSLKPQCLILDLTRRCNMRCPGCIFLLYDREYFSNEEMDLEKAKEIITYYVQQGIKELYITAEGEISLYGDFVELLNFSHDASFEKIHLNTNGYLLNRYVDIIINTVDSVYISVDGYDRQSYQQHRGIDVYDKVIENIKNLVSARNKNKSKLQISLACVIYEEKLFSIEKMIQLAEDLEVNRIEFYNFHNPNPSKSLAGFSALDSETNNLHNYYQKITQKTNYNLEIVLPASLQANKSSYSCENLFNYITIGARGDFTPCCRIPPDPKYGNFQDNPESYQNNKIGEFKENFSHARSIEYLETSCHKCQGLSSETYIYLPQKRVWQKRWLADRNIPVYEHLNLHQEAKDRQKIDWSTLVVCNSERDRLTKQLREKEEAIQTQYQLLQQQQQQLREKEEAIQTQYQLLQQQQQQLREKEKLIQYQKSQICKIQE